MRRDSLILEVDELAAALDDLVQALAIAAAEENFFRLLDIRSQTAKSLSRHE